MAKKSESKAVTKNENLPEELRNELLDDAEEFKESMSKEDMAIPFIQILQQLSPQVDEENPAHIEGAKAGMFFNTVTEELYDAKKDGILVIPLVYKASYIEWVPRTQGGGFVEEYDVATGSTIITARNDINQDIIQQGSPVGTPGNQLSYTHTHYVAIVNGDGTVEFAVLSMASTQVKHSKKWNTNISQLKIPGTVKPAPRFFGVWRATVEHNSNDQGSWYTWTFKKQSTAFDLENGAEIYAQCREFARSVNAGEKKVDYAKVDPDVNPDTGDSDGDDGISF